MKRLAVLFVLIVFVIPESNAQFFKKLKKKAENAVERTVTRRAEREVEKSTDRALDSVIDAPKSKKDKKSKKKKKDQGFNPMSMMGGPVDYLDSYSFPLSVTMEIQEGNKASKKQTMLQFYTKEAFGMKDPESTQITIMDFKNQSALMLNPKDKTGQAVSLKFMSKMMKDVDLDETANDGDAVSFEKTGNSKQIAGYLSYEYRIVTEEGTMNIWFAPEVPFNYKDYMEGFSKLFGKKFQGAWDNSFWDTYGFMMEGENFNKKGKLESKMTVTNIDTSVRNIAIDTYNIQKL